MLDETALEVCLGQYLNLELDWDGFEPVDGWAGRHEELAVKVADGAAAEELQRLFRLLIKDAETNQGLRIS